MLDHSGGYLANLGAVLGNLGAVLGHLGVILGHLGAIVGIDKCPKPFIFLFLALAAFSLRGYSLAFNLSHLGPSWGNLVPSWAIFYHLGATLEPPWGHLGPS